MKKIIFILPYFGQFPPYFDLWLKSAEYNKSIDFLIITDNKKMCYDIPSNVSIKIKSLDCVKNMITSKVKHKIKMKSPYKLCDFKPAYGHIFSEEIKGYDLWGFIDPDIIMGDIKKFLDENILENYDKFYTRGHMTLFKNNDKCNELFKINHKYSDCFSIDDIFKFNSVCAYDEWGWNFCHGLSEIIYRKNIISVYDQIDFADINPNKFKLEAIKNSKSFHYDYFKFEEGHIYGYSDNSKEEFSYIHLQKRRMIATEKITKDTFYIFPNLISTTPIDNEYSLKYKKIFDSDKKIRKVKKFRKLFTTDYILLRIFVIWKKMKGWFERCLG